MSGGFAIAASRHVCLARFRDNCNECSGKHGWCGFRPSHKHLALDGGTRTRKAQKYTPNLCQAIACELCFAVPHRPQSQYVLDVFAGTGGVARACVALGRESFIVDTTWNPAMDACSRSFLRRFNEAAGRNEIAGVMLATPCSSFSLAVSRSGKALRSLSHPRGLPIPMTARESERVKAGNRALDASIQMIRTCNAHGIPFALENPANRYMWADSALQAVLARAFVARLDQCAFKARWRKRTKIAFGNCDR